jgi:ABC-type transport system substrate-binding protein
MNQGRNTHQFPMFLEEDYLIVNRAAYEIPLFFTPGSTINWSNYEADSYGDFAFWDKVQAAVAEKDPAKALSEWADIQTFMAKTAVIGSIVDPGFHVAVKKGLNGFTWNTDNQIRWQFFHWS